MSSLIRLNVAFPPLGNYFSWGSQLTSWNVSGATSATRVKLLNADGTYTLVIGTGFTFGAGGVPTGGTVTQVQHLLGDGVTPFERITSIAAGSPLTSFYNNVTGLTGDVGGLLGGNDSIVGNSQFVDVLFGYAGNDTFNPGAVPGSTSATTIGVNFDVMVGGAGNDTFNAGTSNKLNYIVAYSLETGGAGVTVNLASNTATDTFGNTDTFNNVRYVVATNNVDSLTGGNLDDVFAPGGGADVIDGGAGFNVLTYAYSPTLQTDGFSFTTGITVDYGSATGGTVTDPTGAFDTFSNIQRVHGTNFSDTYNGAAGSQQIFAGMGGIDTYTGNAGDLDMVDCSAEYLTGGTLGITANLGGAQGGAAANRLVDSFGASDILSNINGVIGTESDDTFYGNGNANRFVGNGGLDRFRGNAGNDTFDGGAGRDIAEYRFETGTTPTSGITVNMTSLANGTVTDTFGATDTLINVEQIHGSNRNDVFNGSTGEDRFAPGQGNDQINSGGGRDVIIYSFDTAATSGITFNGGLASNQLTSAYYGTDSFSGFTAGINLVATQLDDNIIGTAASDILQPTTGQDTIDGGAGRDILAYTDSNTTGGVTFNATSSTAGTVTDSGNAGLGIAASIDTYSSIEVLRGSQFGDTFNGSSSADTFQGIQGNDVFHGGGGIDTVDYSYDALVAVFFNLTTHGIDVNLGAGTGTDSFGFTDTFDSIEQVLGTNFVDQITGSGLANRLNGMGGADVLTGGGGNDWFIFDRVLSATNVDTITDFTNAAGDNDVIRLSHAIFTAAGPVGTLSADAFVLGTAAGDATDRIIYDSATGALSYDADGNGAGAAIQFAILGTTTHPTNITEADFVIF